MAAGLSTLDESPAGADRAIESLFHFAALANRFADPNDIELASEEELTNAVTFLYHGWQAVLSLGESFDGTFGRQPSFVDNQPGATATNIGERFENALRQCCRALTRKWELLPDIPMHEAIQRHTAGSVVALALYDDIDLYAGRGPILFTVIGPDGKAFHVDGDPLLILRREDLPRMESEQIYNLDGFDEGGSYKYDGGRWRSVDGSDSPVFHMYFSNPTTPEYSKMTREEVFELFRKAAGQSPS